MVYRLFSCLAAVICVFLAGCSPAAGDLLAYREYPASFTARFPSYTDDAGEVVCEAGLGEGAVTFTITEPERSAGITITCTDGACTVSSGGTAVPVSAEASRALRDFYLVLASETEGEMPVRSDDGESTVVGFEIGSLTLDENLLPCAVVCCGMNGADRCVIIENYTIIKEDPAD